MYSSTEPLTKHDIISTINGFVKEKFINYRPRPRDYTKKTQEYYQTVLDSLQSKDFDTLLKTILNDLKDNEVNGKKPKNFLLVDGLNLYYRFYKNIKEDEKDNARSELRDLFDHYYKGFKIVIITQEHNDFFEKLQDRTNVAYSPFVTVINYSIPSKSEIDDLILVCLYFYINTYRTKFAYVLSFDMYSWLEEFTEQEKKETHFFEQSKLFRDLQKQLQMHNKNLHEGDLNIIMRKHQAYIKEEQRKHQAIRERETRQLTRVLHQRGVQKHLSGSDSDSDRRHPYHHMRERRKSKSRSRSRSRGSRSSNAEGKKILTKKRRFIKERRPTKKRR